LTRRDLALAYAAMMLAKLQPGAALAGIAVITPGASVTLRMHYARPATLHPARSSSPEDWTQVVPSTPAPQSSEHRSASSDNRTRSNIPTRRAQLDRRLCQAFVERAAVNMW